AGNCFWQFIYRDRYNYDINMSSNYRFYFIIKQIHLYASLSTVVLLLMYIVTSYMMMYHDWFKTHDRQEQTISIEVSPNEISEENWTSFLKKHNIKGRLVRENFRESGDLFREYANAGNNFKMTIFKDKNKVEIKSTHLSLAGNIAGLHRMRGYSGPLQYTIYGFLLDLTGFSLMIFAITGILLWLNLLKYNKIAWTILILGFIYVSVIVSYLLFV
ncbi:MAG: PepSY-associated TM helix domain-containing protein, partial [Bacteroidales bacterium]|nr:PepSY-associated TM helix domain-containing protein [Bacteroidales bacterium]